MVDCYDSVPGSGYMVESGKDTNHADKTDGRDTMQENLRHDEATETKNFAVLLASDESYLLGLR